MKKSTSMKLAFMLLTVVMLVGMMAISASAAEVDPDIEINMPDHMTIISDVESTLAPGVIEHKVTVLDSNNAQVVMFIVVADIENYDTVDVYANYKDNDPTTLGPSKVTEQAAAAQLRNTTDTTAPYYNENYTVVAGFNASYPYGSASFAGGLCCGPFVMEGIDATAVDGNGNSIGNSYSFFGVLKDGTYMIGDRGEYTKYKGNLMEAVGGQQHLINAGVKGKFDNTQEYTRQTMGLIMKRDASGNLVYHDNGLPVASKVVFVMAEGLQPPYSIGITVQEQADIMESLGCYEAIHLDNGGSATYCSKPEGSDTFQVTNRPSDGSERSIVNSLIIVSTAAADGKFDRAVLTADNSYVTPSSTVKVSAIGADAAGGAAELPADLSWQLADSSMGTVSNGVFTSNGKTGDAVIQVVSDGEVVGETTVHVVIPDTLTFEQAEILVPYGKSVELSVVAKYGVNEVTLKNGDVNFVLANTNVGTVNGFTFTACAEDAAVTGSGVTAVLVSNINVTASSTITLGKGSEIVEDFEDGSFTYTIVDGYLDNNGGVGQGTTASMEVVTAENGKVRNGDKALAINCDYSQFTSGEGYLQLAIYDWSLENIEGAKSIGMWMYIPEEMADSAWFRFRTFNAGSTSAGKASPDLFATGYMSTIEKGGWYYFTADISGLTQPLRVDHLQMYVSSKDNTNYDYAYLESSNQNAKFTLYVDDITIDYSDAVDDREIPVFSSVNIAYEGLADAVELKGQTITENVVNFGARVDDDKTSNNYTGLDIDSVKVYVDGVAVDAACTAEGVISTGDITLADGTHTVKFLISDKAGNEGWVTRTVVIDADSGMATVDIVPADPDADRLPLASLYWLNVVTDAVETIDTVTFTVDTDAIHIWELEHMIVADGFEVTECEVDEITMSATITLTRTGYVDATGEAVLAELPLRVYEYTLGERAGFANYSENNAWRVEKTWWLMSVDIKTDLGQVTFTDGTTSTFSMTPVSVDTELYDTLINIWGSEGVPADQDGWHQHKTIAWSQAVTCTQNGYTGGTYCEGCASVVDWGTKTAATGHTYVVTDGVLKCECGKLYNGVYTDGKLYIDGVVIADGWNADNTKYYIDGVALTGTHIMDNTVYVFAADGTYEKTASETYLGIVEYNGKTYYAQLGKLVSGWQAVTNPVTDENPDDFIFVDANIYYYFMPDTYEAFEDGYLTVDGKSYEFENGILVDGHWIKSGNDLVLYWAGNKISSGWHTIKGNTYYNYYGYVYTGVAGVMETWDTAASAEYTWYLFADNGALIRKLDGVYGDYVYADGTRLEAYQVVEFEGDYYFISDGHKIARDTEVYLNTVFLNGATYEDGSAMKAGTYKFDADGKMVTLHGVIGNYLYLNGIKQTAYKVVDFNGDYYFVTDGHNIARDCDVYLNTTFLNGAKYADGTAMTAGYYTFDADGKMVIKDGPVNGFFYLGGIRQTAYKVVEYDGYYYFISDGHRLATSTTVYLNNTFLNGATHEDGTLMTAGYYSFDADGKMVTKNGPDADGYFYVNGVKQTAYKVMEYNGDYYFISDGHRIAKNVEVYLYNVFLNGATYEDGTAMTAGYYYFDADGKMVLKNGPVDGFFYINGVKQTAYKVVEFNGNYYFISDGHRIATNTKLYLNNTFLNGATYEDGTAMTAGYYSFDADGKMIVMDGPVDGFFYKNGELQKAYQLVEYKGDYYFISDGHRLATDTQVYLTANYTNGMTMPNGGRFYVGYYTFDAEGKLVF